MNDARYVWDDPRYLCAAVVALALGVYSLVDGIRIQTGRSKSWWVSTLRRSRQDPYVTLPGALFFLILFLSSFSPVRLRQVFLFAAIASVLSAVALWAWRPRFLKPAWVQWLEDHHRQHIPLLRREAGKMIGAMWEERVRTQEGLEQWVAEVLREHGLTEQDPHRQ